MIVANFRSESLQCFQDIPDTGYNRYKVEQLIKQAFFDCDQKLHDKHFPAWGPVPNERAAMSGATCVAVLLTMEHIIFINCGDSRWVELLVSWLCFRAVLASKGKDSKVQVRHSTEDLKPYMHEERERIKRAGGYVQNGRVNGSLAVSRKVSANMKVASRYSIVQSLKL